MLRNKNKQFDIFYVEIYKVWGLLLVNILIIYRKALIIPHRQSETIFWRGIKKGLLKNIYIKLGIYIISTFNDFIILIFLV